MNRHGALAVVWFFALAFGWSWCWWGAAALSGSSADEPPGALFYLLGVFGPLVGAAWLVHRSGAGYRRRFLQRVWDPRGIPGHWWLVLLAVGIGPAGVALAGLGLAGRSAFAADISVAAIIGMAAFGLAAGLAEEPGWRGAASDVWQARTRPVWAAAGIGVLWSLWHVPLSFVEGSYYADLGVGSVRLWLTHIMLIQLGILYVWLANGGGGSILLAIVAHAGFNVAIGMVSETTMRDVLAFITLSAATSAVILITRGRLAYASNPQHWAAHNRGDGEAGH